MHPGTPRPLVCHGLRQQSIRIQQILLEFSSVQKASQFVSSDWKKLTYEKEIVLRIFISKFLQTWREECGWECGGYDRNINFTLPSQSFVIHRTDVWWHVFVIGTSSQLVQFGLVRKKGSDELLWQTCRLAHLSKRTRSLEVRPSWVKWWIKENTALASHIIMVFLDAITLGNVSVTSATC
jgi:hypothetical protein